MFFFVLISRLDHNKIFVFGWKYKYMYFYDFLGFEKWKIIIFYYDLIKLLLITWLFLL